MMSTMSFDAGTRRLSAAICGLAVLCAASVCHAQPDIASDSMLAKYRRAAEIQAANAHRWILNENIVPHWIPGRDRFWYKRELAEGHRFTMVDAATGAKADAFDHARLAKALGAMTGKSFDPSALPLYNVTIDADGVVRFTTAGRAWRFDRAGALSEDAAPRGNYALSPNGKLGVFSKDSNLWVEDMKTGAQTQLTLDGETYYAYGAPPAARTSSSPTPYVVWSPDSTRILTAQTDDRKVPDLPLIDFAPRDGGRPTVLHTRAAMPGDPNTTTFRLVIIDVSTGHQTAIRYLPVAAVRMNESPMEGNRVWWGADSKVAYFVDVERGEKAVHVEAVEADSGQVRELFSEKSDTYVELGSDVYEAASIRPLPQSNELIWYSERSGWAHLYLYSLATGKLIRPLTSGKWLVRNILGVDENRREVYISIAGRTPRKNLYYREIAKVNLDSGVMKVLSASDEDHEVLEQGGISNEEADLEVIAGADPKSLVGVAPSGNYFVETVTTASMPAKTVLRDHDGKLIATVEAADASRVPRFWRWPQPVSLTAADGKAEINGLVFRPSDYDPAKKYPVIDYIYGGPQTAYVPTGFAHGAYLEAASLAELGFVTVMIDGRGSAQRSRAFHTASYGRVETASDLEDHMAGIRELSAADPAIDGSRVGIIGFSAGGYMAAGAMLRYPDFFKVGVAAGGNHDQRLFWNTWGERYEGYPVSDNYTQQANLTYAANLKGKLLLMHGLLDIGVHPAAVFQLEQALIDHNKDFDLLLFPRSHHDIPGYGTRRTWDYFVTNLAGGSPPHEFLLKSNLDYELEHIAAMGVDLNVEKREGTKK
jgi:dipeptidyl aminopeptidase/acylaminoacyl peptidase